MTLAVGICDGCGLVNETYVISYCNVFAVHFTVASYKVFNYTLLTRQSASVLKVGLLCWL